MAAPRNVGLRRRVVIWLKQRPWARRLNAWLEWLVMPVRLRWHARLDRSAPPPADGYPLPSPRLRYRVHGAVDARSFLHV